MLSSRPAYFDKIQKKAAERWEQLERDPELAGPWHQLFKQVQSPRHILSELLQNADDAGATEAIIRTENGAFVFQHNGEDFREEHFASLCRFGYSNKRALHTIGFRGIGFKSTFSLGNRVELYTPTLAVVFDRSRFTEPQWANDNPYSVNLTTVRVEICDERRQTELEKNLEEWLKSPISLLFFKHIRRIAIGDKEVRWGSFGDGPVAGTEWLALHDSPDHPLLIARSQPEKFPEEALAEIREERMLSGEEESDFPPCVVEIVLGIEGRLFVVLPTGVKTALPFACNAPFIQDPARLKIKDPETSPTNRWLLERAGKLAADVMLTWLQKSELSSRERADAYDLMPDLDRESRTLEGTCGAIVEQAFDDAIAEQNILLTEAGDLVSQEQAIVLPRPIHEVWPEQQVTALFDDEGRPCLSLHVSDANRDKLANWNLVDAVDDEDALRALRTNHFPRPESWRRLLTLWAYVSPIVTAWRYRGGKNLRIVPVQGKDVLFAPDEAVRLGEKKLVPSEEDWQFLGDRLAVVNQNWLRFLTEQRRIAEENDDEDLSELVEAAEELLEVLDLDEPSDTGKALTQVASDFFAQEEVKPTDAIRLAQIAAKLGASVGEAFQFITADRSIRSTDEQVLHDPNGMLEFILPENWCETRLLHPDYTREFSSCTREEWHRWVMRGQSRLLPFLPFISTSERWMSRSNLDALLVRRGYDHPLNSRYSNPWFHLKDWDFPAEIWSHWEAEAADDDTYWGKVGETLLATPSWFWSEYQSASVTEEASNGHTRQAVREGLIPAWVVKLRDKPCLPDRHGIYREPTDLLRSTPQTDALVDVEPFVQAILDTESSRPLLSLLGVGDTPTRPDKLITRLRALSKSKNAPAHEAEKWYRRLDSILDGCSTDTARTIAQQFREERLILTEQGNWESSAGVFLTANEEDAPGAETIRPSVRDLTLWRRIGVEERPSAELAIGWLAQLPSGKALSQEDGRRVRALLSRHPVRVWEDCGHWLNLAGEWAPTADLCYALTMQPLIPHAHFHQWVKQATADLRLLRDDVLQALPFSSMPLLASHVDEQLCRDQLTIGERGDRPWLQQLGLELQRAELDDEQETDRVRALAAQLSASSWVTASRLEIIPYIEGKPAGTARSVEAVWTSGSLFVANKPVARCARAVANELGRHFRRPEIIDAIKLCFDHAPAYVTEYMEENFHLIPREEIEAVPQQPIAAQTTSQQTETSAVDDDRANPAGDEADDQPGPSDRSEPAEPAFDGPAEDGDELAIAPEVDGHDQNDEERPLRRQRPKHPDFMERFALSQGFRKDHDARYFDDEGNWIARANGALFPWERRSASGEVTKHYFPKDHCLERDPLQIGAEIWSMIEKQPTSYVLILSGPNGEPTEVSGKHLCELKESGALTLHPSTYRLVYEHDK